MRDCTREDLRVEVIASAHVDDQGQVVHDDLLDLTAGVHHTSRPYWCECCDEAFADWEVALKHLEGEA